MSKPFDHVRLVIPGPVEVRPEILEAQTHVMIGHRAPEIEELISSLQSKLKKAFLTQYRVLISGSSGTGLWEGASRNCIRDGHKVLHLTGGAFSDRWAKISEANGKTAVTLPVEWGMGHTAEMVDDVLKQGGFDAVCMVHNETSTGVVNPVKEIGEVVRQYDDVLLLVDTVSGFLGAELRVDEWGVDVALTSSQKALAVPPGISFAAVSDRVMERAKDVKNRGYYFDFIALDASLQKNQTPSTPPIPLMYATDVQLSAILEQGLEARWAHHAAMCDVTQKWALDRGFGLFAQEGFRSPTVTAIDNRERSIDTSAMKAFMRERGYLMDAGYGKIKGKTFRIGHLGDMTMDTLEDILSNLDAFVQ